MATPMGTPLSLLPATCCCLCIRSVRLFSVNALFRNARALFLVGNATVPLWWWRTCLHVAYTLATLVKSVCYAR
jgi:hypothetical protein